MARTLSTSPAPTGGPLADRSRSRAATRTASSLARLARGAALSLAWASIWAASSGCATGPAVRLEEQPLSKSRDWVSTVGRKNPLVGQIWQVRENRFVEEATLVSALTQADFVLLGETHDNPDHHLLQAKLVEAICAAGRQPALAFEMLQTSKQAALNAALVGRAPSPEALAAAVDWKHSRWPDFAIYRPVFEAGIRGGLPLLAADLTQESVRLFSSEGLAAFSPAVRGLLDRAGPLPPKLEREMEEEMESVHCGQLPRSALAHLVVLQRARDASLANRLLTADAEFSPAGYEQGAILIAGSGHVRTDRGVPAYLSREAPGRSVVSVAFVEVSGSLSEPDDYAKEFAVGALPFDYVVFTPATERRDPCLEFKRKREPQDGRSVALHLSGSPFPQPGVE